MPAQYEAVRDKLVAKGMDYDDAQKHAAMIYNARHPGHPMSGKSEGRPSSAHKDALLKMLK